MRIRPIELTILITFLASGALAQTPPPVITPPPAAQTSPTPPAQPAPPAGATNPAPATTPPPNAPGNPPPAPGNNSLSNNQATVVPPDFGKDQYQYDNSRGRDPFKIPQLIGSTDTKQVSIIDNPLENAILPGGVKVLAIIHDSRNPRALVRANTDNRTYTVFKNSKVGQGGGSVQDIREDEVVIVRTVNDEGETKVETFLLKIREKEPERKR